MIKPIETKFAGHVMRSRLEARWACFFTTLDLPWVYEKEAYSDGVLAYLPDFFLPTLDCWFEVKGEKPGDEYKQAMLAVVTKQLVYLTFDQIPYPDPHSYSSKNPTWDSCHLLYPDGGWDNRYYFTICPTCNKIGLHRSGRLPKACRAHVHVEWGHDHPRLLEAYRAAREERFGT